MASVSKKVQFVVSKLSAQPTYHMLRSGTQHRFSTNGFQKAVVGRSHGCIHVLSKDIYGQETDGHPSPRKPCRYPITQTNIRPVGSSPRTPFAMRCSFCGRVLIRCDNFACLLYMIDFINDIRNS